MSTFEIRELRWKVGGCNRLHQFSSPTTHHANSDTDENLIVSIQASTICDINRLAVRAHSTLYMRTMLVPRLREVPYLNTSNISAQ